MANQKKLRDHWTGERPKEPSSRGAPREGKALLQGLVLCGRCGHCMHTQYSSSNGQRPHYKCNGPKYKEGVSGGCWMVSTKHIDAAVARAFLGVIQPAEVDLALSHDPVEEGLLGLPPAVATERCAGGSRMALPGSRRVGKGGHCGAHRKRRASRTRASSQGQRPRDKGRRQPRGQGTASRGSDSCSLPDVPEAGRRTSRDDSASVLDGVIKRRVPPIPGSTAGRRWVPPEPRPPRSRNRRRRAAKLEQKRPSEFLRQAAEENAKQVIREHKRARLKRLLAELPPGNLSDEEAERLADEVRHEVGEPG